jgi:uncharacterized membrane protein YesL
LETPKRVLSSQEKELYQQIHPAKLATDIASFVLSTYIIWIHQLILGVLAGFIPATIASVIVVRYANLERYVASRLGRYVAKYVTRTMEAVRFVGLFVSWGGGCITFGGLSGSAS